MLAVPSSRITQRSCPEGTAGWGISDTKALSLGPVISVKCYKLQEVVVQIQPEIVKFSQFGCILCHWLMSVGTKVIILNLWSGPCVRRLCAGSCCLCCKLIYRCSAVLNMTASKPDFHSEQKLTWRWCSECPELCAASPHLLTHQ